MKAECLIALSLLVLLSVPTAAAAETTPLWTHTIGGTGVGAVAISGDGSTVCAAGEDGLVCLSPEGTVQWSTPLRMYDVALSDDGSIVIAGGFDIHVFDDGGTQVGGRKVFNVIRSIAVDPEGTAYLASTDGSTIVEGSPLLDTATETATGEDYFAVSLVPGTDYLTAGTETGSVLLSSPGVDTVFWEYRASPEGVKDIAAADGARTIVACTGDGMILALTRSGLLLWSAPFDRPAGVAVSRDGERIGVCGAEGFTLHDRSGARLASVSMAGGCTGIALNSDATLAAVTTGHDVSLYSPFTGEAATPADTQTPAAPAGPAAEADGLFASAAPTGYPDDSATHADVPTPTQAAPGLLAAVAGLVGTLASCGKKK